MSQSQYDELRRGYAENLGFKSDNLTEEQEHQLIEAMAADGIVAPLTKALPGGEVNPSNGNGNGVEIVTTTKGKATTKNKNKKPSASIGNLDDSIKQVLVSASEQGLNVGELAGSLFIHQAVTRRDEVILDSFADALIPSKYAGMTVADFLSTV